MNQQVCRSPASLIPLPLSTAHKGGNSGTEKSENSKQTPEVHRGRRVIIICLDLKKFNQNLLVLIIFNLFFLFFRERDGGKEGGMERRGGREVGGERDRDAFVVPLFMPSLTDSHMCPDLGSHHNTGLLGTH